MREKIHQPTIESKSFSNSITYQLEWPMACHINIEKIKESFITKPFQSYKIKGKDEN